MSDYKYEVMWKSMKNAIANLIEKYENGSFEKDVMQTFLDMVNDQERIFDETEERINATKTTNEGECAD